MVTGDSVRGGVFIKVMTTDLILELRTVVVILYIGKELIQLRLVGDHSHRVIDEHGTHNVSKTVLYLTHNELFSVRSIGLAHQMETAPGNL